ncbi:hypothetical protein GCM10010172_36310 [Paractinoplanes ferrugineus]|uniref:Uncharacterized protein n=1 Tax=Paractinoplanes ferrugineus TaxID=113564 RepID=A0A919MIK8_9ACTN|nr:hypothetical protein [Actinoplanes ferrugineus]GIE09227.1 hypothetical protein Afe05nite_10670 [Actinoplanes ferrugineus]
MTIYIARTAKFTLVSWEAARFPGARAVRHGWDGVVESGGSVKRASLDTAMVVIPPLVLAAVLAVFLPAELAALAGAVVAVVLFALAQYLRHRVPREPTGRGPAVHRLTGIPERTRFDRFVDTAERVSRTWPALGGLVDEAAASAMLSTALWEISGVLARRQELTAVLTELSRPDFAAASPDDRTALELQTQLRATKQALSDIEIDLAAREASLRRAEEAGRAFIREQEMRRAIRAAEESLHPDAAAARPADAGAELAEQTNLVLDAYRELTAGLHRPDAPPSSGAQA